MYDEYNKAKREFYSRDPKRKYAAETDKIYYDLESVVSTIRILKDLELSKEFREERNKIREKIQKLSEEALKRIREEK